MTTEQLKEIGEERIRLARELQGIRCYCGAKKTSMRTFCPKHYFALPKSMRDALYKGICDGYVDAYKRARKYFEEMEK